MKEIMLNDFSTLFPACIFIFTRTLGKNIYIHIRDLFCARLFHRIAKKKKLAERISLVDINMSCPPQGIAFCSLT